MKLVTAPMVPSHGNSMTPTLSMTYGTNESSYKLGYSSGKIGEVDLVTENCHFADIQNTILHGIIISGIRIDNPK